MEIAVFYKPEKLYEKMKAEVEKRVGKPIYAG